MSKKFDFDAFNKLKTKVAKKAAVATPYGEVIVKQLNGYELLELADETKTQPQKIEYAISKGIITPSFKPDDILALVKNDSKTAIEIFSKILELSNEDFEDVEEIKKN